MTALGRLGFLFSPRVVELCDFHGGDIDVCVRFGDHGNLSVSAGNKASVPHDHQVLVVPVPT